jgi:hypothetical protein
LIESSSNNQFKLPLSKANKAAVRNDLNLALTGLAEGEGDVRKMSCNVCGSNSEIWKYVDEDRVR